MGKTCHFFCKKYIFAIELQISKRYIDMKKEKNFSDTDFSEKDFSEKILESMMPLSFEGIL